MDGLYNRSISSTSVGELVVRKDRDVQPVSQAWAKQAQASVPVRAQYLASIVPMRADLALEVRLQERELEQEDSWEPAFLVLLVCERPSRLGGRGHSDLLLEEAKLQGVEAEVVLEEVASNQENIHLLHHVWI
jgi:hypothetical protein